MVKSLPAMKETWVLSLDQEDPLEKRISSPVFLPGEFHRLRRLAGYSPWGGKESDTTEKLHFHFHKHTFLSLKLVLRISSEKHTHREMNVS